ncbi:MAG: RHS repeat-associated core domain-containing protein [Fimbriimonadaceae bacterium]|nr:RHS repeat-associated core domain-containing protein [Fimbriimonadaceae bacterium]
MLLMSSEPAYHGDGLRAWKEGATRTYFLYDGINVVCELDAVGDLLAASTFGAAGLLCQGAVQYQFDPLGDAVHLLDAAGDVTANRLFDAWGNELTSDGFNPRGYRATYGYYTDEETGLVALAYRYYGPGVGRFLNRDPVGYAGGVNLYGYVQNRPPKQTDGLGLLLGIDDIVMIVVIGIVIVGAGIVAMAATGGECDVFGSAERSRRRAYQFTCVEGVHYTKGSSLDEWGTRCWMACLDFCGPDDLVCSQTCAEIWMPRKH